MGEYTQSFKEAIVKKLGGSRREERSHRREGPDGSASRRLAGFG